MRCPRVVRTTIVMLGRYCCWNGTYTQARARPSMRLLDCMSRATPTTSSVRIGCVGPCGPQVGCDKYLPTAFLSRPELPRRRLTDNRDRRRSVAVVGSEISSRHDRSPQRGEITGLDHVPIHGDKALAGRRRAAWNGQRFPPDLESAGQGTCDRRRLHARQQANAIDQFANEGPACRVGIAPLRQVDRHELDTMRIETRIDRSGPVERAYEQASGDDEDDAEGDLPDDKRMPQAQAADTRSLVSQARQDIRSSTRQALAPVPTATPPQRRVPQ